MANMTDMEAQTSIDRPQAPLSTDPAQAHLELNCLSVVFIAAGFLVADLFLADDNGFPHASSFTTQACTTVTGSDECLRVQPFQPEAEDMAFIDRIYEAGADGFTFTMYGNSQKTVLIDGIPFSQYWQLENPDHYVFHPMVWGRFVFNGAKTAALAEKLPSHTARVGTTLPENGGVAFYYPNHYPLNRMCGPDLIYSAISQSEILAGYLQSELQYPSARARSLTDSVKQALLFPHTKGGTNLSNVALLEVPLFRSNPEIVLNGWLHALLHLNDYAIVRSDVNASEVVERHLRFFADNYKVWYDDNRNISRYSDTSPHRVIVTRDLPDQAFAVVYESVTEPLNDYVFVPVMDLDREYSGFDTRIVHVKKNSDSMIMVVTCSGLFNTWIVSSDPFSIRIRDGGYDPMKTTPTATGHWRPVQAQHVEHAGLEAPLYRLRIALDDHELIRGYPTNFAKANGKNFYHGQHIVALKYLANGGSFNAPDLKVRLARIADSWFARTKAFQYRELSDFEPLQSVLDSINRGKILTPFTTIDQMGLEEWSK